MGRANKVSRKNKDIDFCLSDLLDNGVTQTYNHQSISDYEQRIRQTNNGKFIDPDSFFVVASYLTPETVASLRQVCLHWHKFFSSNLIWQPLFQFYFDPDASDRDVDTFSTNDPSSYWFVRFSHTMAKIPQIDGDIPKNYRDKDLYDNIHLDCTLKETDFIHEITQIEHRLGKVTCSPEIVTKNTHKVAVVLSILNIHHRYWPKATDIVRIGYRNNNKEIPLGRICYALLYGREESLFPIHPKDVHFREDPDIDEDSNDRLFNNPKMNYVKSWYNGTDDSFVPKKDTDKKPNISVGMCPKVIGEFVPFVHYLDINGTENIPGLYLKSSYALDKASDFESMYFWSTSENGWAPTFFNASFTWFEYMHVVSGYNPKNGELVSMFVKGGTAVF